MLRQTLQLSQAAQDYQQHDNSQMCKMTCCMVCNQCCLDDKHQAVSLTRCIWLLEEGCCGMLDNCGHEVLVYIQEVSITKQALIQVALVQYCET